jgi:hypothetical protein
MEKLINKIDKQLNDQGFYTTIDQFGDNSGKWIDIYQTSKQRSKGNSIGSVTFNIRGTQITDISWHKKNGDCFRFNFNKPKPKKK